MDINAISNRTIFRILVIVSLFFGLLYLGTLAHRELAWVATAFFLAVALNPAVDRLSKFMPKKSRGLATGLTFILMLSILTVLGLTLIPPMVRQSQSLGNNLPQYIDQVTNSDNLVGQLIRRYDLIDQLRAQQKQLLGDVSKASGDLIGLARGFFSSLAATIAVLGLTFFMLLEGPKWVKRFWQIQPPKYRDHYQQISLQMYRAVTGYVTGNVLTSLVAFLATTIALTILGIPYAIPLGLLVGILDLLPLIGATLGAVVVILICLFSSVSAAVIMLIFFLIYQQFENHVLQPMVYSRTIQMSPLLVLVSAILGAALGGILGALVAIPIAASLQILAKDYLQHRAKGR